MMEMAVKRGHRRLIQRRVATAKGIPGNQPLITNILKTKMSDLATNSKRDPTRIPDNRLLYTNKDMSPYDVMEITSPRSMSNTSCTNYNTAAITQNRLSSYPIPSSTACNTGNGNNGNCNSGNSSSSNSSIQPHNSLNTNQISAGLSDGRSSGASSNDDNDSVDTDANDSLRPTTKRKYRRHAKPDANAPVKPPSAYIMFSNDARVELKNQNLSFSELAKIVGEQWKNLSHHEKQRYERLAMHAKDEYMVALEHYSQTPEYKKYHEYLQEFKSKQHAANRLISKAKKRAKQESPGSGSIADSSSNGNSNGNGSSGSGSTDTYGDKDTVLRRQRRSTSHDQREWEGQEEEDPKQHPQLVPHQSSSDSGYTSQSYYSSGCNNNINNANNPIINNNHTHHTNGILDKSNNNWDNRSKLMLRGILPVEFVHTGEPFNANPTTIYPASRREIRPYRELIDDDGESSQHEANKRRSPRFNKIISDA
ncbi:hypothetical protein BDB01DRAFT_842777 [Pilobolus umbonatus]|nr:hypothetical protein BDB01DRAFT_842777 [Pilobolus umbonatus]